VRELRVTVDQAGNHDEVIRHSLCVLFTECLELGSCDPVELARLHVLGDDRVVMTRANGLRAIGVAVDGSFALACGAIAAGRRAASGPESLLVAAGTLGPRVVTLRRATCARSAALGATT